MPKNTPVPEQLQQQLATVKDGFAKYAGGTHGLHAALARTPTNTQQVGLVLGAVNVSRQIARMQWDKCSNHSFEWFGHSWLLSISGQSADHIIYQSRAADASTLICIIDEILPEVAELKPAQAWASHSGITESLRICHWTMDLFWLALGIRDDPLLRAEVCELDEKQPHPTGYSISILPAGVAPDSSDWPALGFASLNCDLFTASVRACEWYFARITANVTDRHAVTNSNQEQQVAGNHLMCVQEPSKEARQAYQAYFGTNKTQTEVAEMMTKTHRRSINQGQVSRWVREVKEWRKSQNLPIDKKAAPSQSIDPESLVIGTRTDGHRTGDPRYHQDSDD